ncbi:MAG: MBL fold metallo-hydrolase [Gemmatimonadaceae bacterium]
MRVWVLGSGSRGNAILLECGDTRILIDAGFPPRVLAERLLAAGVEPSSISDCVLTHEHADHACGASACALRWGWQLHATRGTLRASQSLRESGANPMDREVPLTLGRLELRATGVPHDATEPVLIVATSAVTGARVAIAYDLGHATAAVRDALCCVDILVLESNHDEGMLRAGPYPPSVRHRIGGPLGHLGNSAAASLSAKCVHRGLSHLVLAHLSDRCNQPGLALTAMSIALARTRFRGMLSVSEQNTVLGPFGPAAGSSAVKAEQLSLRL